jgi:hypothetical protein
MSNRAEGLDPILDDAVYSVDHGADQLDDRVLVPVRAQLRLQGDAVGVAEVGVDVDLADADPGRIPIDRKSRFWSVTVLGSEHGVRNWRTDRRCS